MAQGYEVHENNVFQGNQSALLLQKNGKHSSSCWMHHINIHYFFVTNHIQSKELMVEYCPTDEMLVDMFTKPLQGVALHCFCTAILNLPDDNEICPTVVSMAGHRSVLGNEPATCDSRQTNKLIRSERSNRWLNRWPRIT